MKVIQQTIKNLDFFGPQITFKTEANFKTVLGGSVSLTVYCLYVIFFILFGKDMNFKLNPIFSLEKLTPENQERYTIDSDTFIAWRIENLNGITSNVTKLLNVYVTYINFDNLISIF